MKKLNHILMLLLVAGLVFGCGRKEAQELKTRLAPQKETTYETVEEAAPIKAETVTLIALVAADFDSGTKPNNLGGDFGTWDKDPNDQTMYIHMSFNDANAKDKGYCLRLDYDVDSPNPAYNGLWMKLEDLDLRPYKKLSMDVKGDNAAGYTTKFKLELKNRNGEVGKYLLKGVTDSWQEMVVPLEDFRGIADWSDMTEFVIIFDDVNVTGKIGTLYIDNVKFTN